jgi:hypothetical protein
MNMYLKLSMLLGAMLCTLLPGAVSGITAEEAIERSKRTMLDIPAHYEEMERTLSAQLADKLVVAAETQKVAILVDKPLYGHIAEGISNYVNGVEGNLPFDILVYNDQEWRTQTFEQVRAFIKNLWQTEDITGVILVGFFPHMQYNLPGQVRYKTTYSGQMGVIGYEDLDGEFLDLGAWVQDEGSWVFQPGAPNGVYDHHVWKPEGGSFNPQTDVTLEIWCSLMRPYQTSVESLEYTSSVIYQMQAYMDKLDRYYRGEIVVPKRGLAYCNRDWGGVTPGFRNRFAAHYGSDNVSSAGGSGVYNSGQDYMELRSRGFEMATVWVHSSSWFHQFDRWPWHDVQNYELIPENGRGSMITWAWACHVSDYPETPTGCLSQHYIFEGIGQVCIGSAMSYGVSSIGSQIDRMRGGDCAGEAFRATVEADYRNNGGLNQRTNMTIICQTMYGNPLLFTSNDERISAPEAKIAGTVGTFEGSGQYQVKFVVYKDDEVFSYEISETDGTFEIPFLEAGSYRIEMYTLGGCNVGTLNYTLTEGEQLTSETITVPEAGYNQNDWYYELKSSIPDGWEDPDKDMSGVSHGPAPFGRQSDKGTYLEFGSRLNIRKTFVIGNKEDDEPVYLNVTSYREGDDMGARVNGQGVSFQGFAAKPEYWRRTADITSLLVEGTNVVVVWGKNYLDASCPEYTIISAAELAVDSQLYYPTNVVQKEIQIVNAGTNELNYTAQEVHPVSWLTLVNTNGTVATTGAITTQVDRTGLDPGVYYAKIAIDAGKAGAATVTVAMSCSIMDYRASAEWQTTVGAENPHGQWMYDYSRPGPRVFPYTPLPFYNTGVVDNLCYVWYSDGAPYNSKIGMKPGGAAGSDLHFICANLRDKATALGWRAPEDGAIHSIRGMWEYGDPDNPARVIIDYVRDDAVYETLYDFDKTGLVEYSEYIINTSMVFVASNDIIYFTCTPNNDENLMPPITLCGGEYDYCISFEPGVIPEPGGILLMIIGVAYAINRRIRYNTYPR